jgi:hypothetical protein
MNAILERLYGMDPTTPYPTARDVAVVVLRTIADVAPAVGNAVAHQFNIDLGER